MHQGPFQLPLEHRMKGLHIPQPTAATISTHAAGYGPRDENLYLTKN
jgi:hypothetical protein